MDTETVQTPEGSTTAPATPPAIEPTGHDFLPADQDPSTTDQDPLPTDQGPAVTNQAPLLTDQNPSTTGQNLSTDQDLSTTNEDPLPIDQDPLTTNEAPLSPDQDPVTANQALLKTDQDPPTTNEDPLTTDQDPSTTNEAPLPTEQDPSTTNQDPLPTDQDLSTTDQDPISTGQDPSTTNQAPLPTDQDLSTTDQDPISTGQDPSTTGQAPSSADSAPLPAEEGTSPKGTAQTPVSRSTPATRDTHRPGRDPVSLPVAEARPPVGERKAKKAESHTLLPVPHPHSYHGPTHRAKSSSSLPPLALDQVAIVAASQNKLPTSKVKGIVMRMGRHTQSSAGKRGRWYKNDNYVDNSNYSWRNMELFIDYQKQMYTPLGTVKASCKK